MHCHSGLPLVHPLDDSKPAPVTQGEGSCTCRANGSLAELRAYTRCRVFDSELTNDTTPSKNFSSCVSSISLVYRHESFPNPKSIHPPFIFQQRSRGFIISPLTGTYNERILRKAGINPIDQRINRHCPSPSINDQSVQPRLTRNIPYESYKLAARLLASTNFATFLHTVCICLVHIQRVRI